MIFENKKREIKALTFISSAKCNLNCNFCYLHKNQSYVNFNKIIIESWENQTYINNVAKSLDKLEVDFNLIDTISLWGGEPLLSIDKLIPSIKNFYKFFPNISYWKTSTNFTINIQNLINFILEIEKYTNQNTIFSLQLSIDGPEGIFTENGHNVSWETYKKQFEKLISNLNNINLQKINLDIFLKSTIEEQLYLKYFSNLKNMENYYDNMLKLQNYVNSLIINKNIHWSSSIHFPAPSIPSNASSEDGLLYNKIARSWQYLKKNKFKNINQNIELYRGIGRIDNAINLFDQNHECAELKNALTFWPDGTIVECAGCFMLPNKEYQQELIDNNEDDEFKIAKIGEATSYNPLLMSVEEIELHDWFTLNGFRNNYSTYYNLMLGLCHELALSGQIAEKYGIDDEITLKHISLVLQYIGCTRENIKTTKIPYLCQPATYRKFFNGLIDYVSEQQINKLKG